MSADKKATYVATTGSDGRKYYDPRFIAGVCADIRSQVKTVDQAAAEFGVARTTLYAWLRRTHPPRKPRKVDTPEVRAGSPLEKALQASVSPMEELDKTLRDQYDLILAYAAGRIGAEGLKAGLGRKADKKFMVMAWVGKFTLHALKAGWEFKP